MGKRPNPVKLALLATSITFWWYCNNGVTNILAGIALFEVFHDVQYLSLVWIYNRSRVEKDSSIGGFMRFIFRRSGSLIGVYIGLVFAYGSLGIFKERVEVETMKRILTGVVAASGLLHFYYDGFIWKVRERATRESLGLTGGIASAGSRGFFPSWLVHGLKWVAVFVIPLGALWIGQTRGPAPILQRAGWIVADLPLGATPRFEYATRLKAAGRFDEAAQQFLVGLRFSPDDEKGHYNLASVLLHQSKVEEGARHLEQALRLDPRNSDFHSDYGYALELRGRRDEALAEYTAALRLNPKSALVHYNYAMFLVREGKTKEAAGHFENALEIEPKYADAHYDFGNLLYEKRDLESANFHYLAAARIAPRRAIVHNMLGIIFLRQGQTSQAILQFAEALELDPNDSYAAENLRRAQAIDARLGASELR